MKFLASLEKRSKLFWMILGFLLIMVMGFLDFLTGYELSFSLFYLIPITLVAWTSGRRLGILASVLSSFAWFIADIAAGNVYSGPFFYVWNTFIRLGFFVLTTLLLASLREALEHEKELAHFDYLTGAVNSRFFYELVRIQIDQSQRSNRPFALAYIDLDDFKTINDQFGHSVGDQVLKSVVDCAKRHLRKKDVVARLGGDEFVLLLTDTDQESARKAVSRCKLAISEEMRRSNWPVTVSIGVLTCTAASVSSDQLLKAVDELMYAAKRSGKNAIEYSTYTG